MAKLGQRIARLDDKISTRLERLAQRPALAHYIAREFGLTFTSGWRSKAHNAAVGGVPNSWHTRGNLANPGAVDLVGPMDNMQRALAWAKQNVPNLAEAMIHTVDSGLHLHLGGTGVMEWRLPQRKGMLARWRQRRTELNERRTRQRVYRTLHRNGARYISIIDRESRRTGLPFPLALALIEQESNFRNVYGHDATIFAGAGEVTRANYAKYLSQRGPKGRGGMQGVGPAQLTWYALQDEADRRGGAWNPEHNISTAFDHLASLIKAHGEQAGIERYNGTGPAAERYRQQVAAKRALWAKHLSA